MQLRASVSSCPVDVEIQTTKVVAGVKRLIIDDLGKLFILCTKQTFKYLRK